MRRYDESVEVRRGQVGDLPGPEQFLWRGRLWKVRAVLSHWIETGEWWHSDSARTTRGDEGDERAVALAPVAELLAEREVWRIEAGNGVSVGVFELAFDWSGHPGGSWRLLGCVD